MTDIRKKLDTKAKDNHGNSYDVELQMRDSTSGTFFPKDEKEAADIQRKFANRWVLRILGTPGCWCLSTVMNCPGNTISLDFGQKWDCVNFQDILKEAKELM